MGQLAGLTLSLEVQGKVGGGSPGQGSKTTSPGRFKGGRAVKSVPVLATDIQKVLNIFKKNTFTIFILFAFCLCP
jgi:hypothetical protein